jgi:hypothetical protein
MYAPPEDPLTITLASYMCFWVLEMRIIFHQSSPEWHLRKCGSSLKTPRPPLLRSKPPLDMYDDNVMSARCLPHPSVTSVPNLCPYL